MGNYKLENAPVSIKILITCFLLIMLLGYAVALINTHNKMGRGFDGIVSHYRGSEDGMSFPKEFSELVEMSHSHLFGMPLMYLVFGFIFAFTSLKEIYKGGIIVLAFASIFIYTIAIWLIRYVAPFFAFLLILSNLFLMLSFLFFFAVPLLEMWFPQWHRNKVFVRIFTQ
jgi:hypothetical protein